MRRWTVAGGLLERDGRLLLVQNRRRDGSIDWSTPGGVIDEGESLIEGLTREVEEETGFAVADWEGPLWDVHVDAPGLGWTLRVEVHRATSFDGSLQIADPDGIVVDAAWHDRDECHRSLATSWVPAREPMLAWLAQRWRERRSYRYRLAGADRAEATITRLDE